MIVGTLQSAQIGEHVEMAALIIKQFRNSGLYSPFTALCLWQEMARRAKSTGTV
jgi:hypothetical protein